MAASSWTPLHDRLHQTIRHRGLFVKGDSILMAVSGGQDSLCLARLMIDLQTKWQWRLAIAHCNHRWVVDSPLLPGHVEKMAKVWHVPFYLATAPDEVAHDSREATARGWRYHALTELAQTHQFSCVTTAHTASDRAETLLYNLLRGSGLNGLVALGWSRPLTPEIRLVRPILNVTRSETGAFCSEAQLSVWDDPANADLRYARNRLRNEVLPYLQQYFNPNVEGTLTTTAEIIQADVEFLESEAERLFQVAVEFSAASSDVSDGGSELRTSDRIFEQRNRESILRINRRVLQGQPLSLQRRVMRRCLLAILPKAPTFEHIEKLSALVQAPNRSQTDPFPGGAIAQVNQEWIDMVLRQDLRTSCENPRV